MKPLGYAALLALVACAPSAPASPPESRAGWRIDPGADLNAFFDCLAGAGATLVAAHRGGPQEGYPENALETLAHTLEQAPALLEIDVAASADGVLFLLHDDRLERTTTGAGEAATLPFAEIAGLRLEDGAGTRSPFHPTRFDAALAFADGRTILKVDIKRSAAYEAVAETIVTAGAARRVILIAYTLAQAQKLHRLLPETMISLNIGSMSELNGAVAAGVPADRLIGFTGAGAQAPNERLFGILAGRGVEADFGALGRAGVDADIERSGAEARYAEIAAMGADILTTDRPAAAHAALQAAGRAPKDGECGIRKE